VTATPDVDVLVPSADPTVGPLVVVVPSEADDLTVVVDDRSASPVETVDPVDDDEGSSLLQATSPNAATVPRTSDIRMRVIPQQ